MGWRTSALLISPSDLVRDDEALELGGFEGPSGLSECFVADVMNPKGDEIGLAGFPKGKAVFSAMRIPDLALGSSGGGGGGEADTGPRSPLGEYLWFSSLDGEIAYVALNSTVNAYALVLWRDGELTRALAGSAGENGGLPHLNHGRRLRYEPLPTYDLTRELERLRAAGATEAFEETRAKLEDGPEGDVSYPVIGETLICDAFEDLLGRSPSVPAADDVDFNELPAFRFSQTRKNKAKAG